ncbi:sel1 repeat family protein [Streptomyces sp. NRRL S-118]|uniref:sel1 repeat family protein n=1 Tax=Streptomyces sp. NRRL S-118 TaxID=1463881 RepID=UPI000693871A|nr:sel1 repeat family protein [Streptomyces sp. NRRL S-118]
MDDRELRALAADLRQQLTGPAWPAVRARVAAVDKLAASELELLAFELGRYGDNPRVRAVLTEWVRRFVAQGPSARAGLRETIRSAAGPSPTREPAQPAAAPAAEPPAGGPQAAAEREAENRAVARAAADAAGADIAAAVRADNDVSGGVFLGPVVQTGTLGSVRFGPPAPPDPAVWLPVSETDPVVLGARHGGPYVRRDRDAELAEVRGFVLVTGEPLSGRTTTAWAAMVRALPGHRVCVPPPGTDLRALAPHGGGPWVLWLDDLEGHLHERGLDTGLLARLTGAGVPVLATMSDEAYDRHRFGSSPHARVLSRARTVELSLDWSEDELARLAEPGEPRHEEALLWRGATGVTQYLGLGPELWAEWQRARRPANHPRGHLLVRAAVDLALCGTTAPLPEELLRETHELYGADAPGESFEDALAWAARPRLGITGLLVREGGGWRPYGSLLAEALRSDAVPPTPDAVWDAALAHEPEAVTTAARIHYRHAAQAGEPDAMFRLARLGGDETWLRKAADAGHPGACGELGGLLAGRGEGRAAEPYLETAAGAGDARAATLLAKLLQDRARHWLVTAARAGDPEAAHRLGDVLFAEGDTDGAFDLYLQASHAGYAAVAGSFGALHRYQGEEKVAVVWLRRAIDAGDTRRSESLEALRIRSLAEADEFFRDDAARGCGLDPVNLGVLLENHGDTDEARTWYEKGFALGDAYGAFRLARLLEKEGRPGEAAAWLRKAAGAGHPGAKEALAAAADTVEE